MKINLLQIWRSTYECDAGLFTKASRPMTILSLYEKCDAIPKVHLMQVITISVYSVYITNSLKSILVGKRAFNLPRHFIDLGLSRG